MRSPLLGILLSSSIALAQSAAPPSTPAPTPAPPTPPAPPTASTPTSPAPTPAPPAPPTASPPAPPTASTPTSTSATPTSTSAAPTAPVARGNGLSYVAVDELPERCRDLGKRADSPSANAALSARTSLAACLVEERTKPLALCDCEQSIHELDDASTQSIALLDEVVAVGDPTLRILALQVEGDLFAGFATRILATVPAPTNGSEAAINLHDTRMDLIAPLVLPWQQRARTVYTQLDTIARANPRLAKNAAVLAAVRSSRAKLASLQSAMTGVATRESKAPATTPPQ
jgi:hypothetical protein